MFYAFRVDGPNDPAAGHRFNPNKVLISPYARGISQAICGSAPTPIGPQDNLATSHALRRRRSRRRTTGRAIGR